MEPKTEMEEWETDLCSLVVDEWERGSQHYDQMNDLYDDLYAMLRGERPEKTYDWQSNVVINKVFQVIWTAIPYISQKVFGGTPIIGVRSFDNFGAWEREQILEFWNTMNAPADKKFVPFFIVFVMWTLRACLNGVGIMKKSWHQKLKRTAKEQTTNIPTSEDAEGNLLTEPHTSKKTTTVPVEDWPHNVVVNNKDIVFDWLLKPGESIRNGRFIIHREIQDLDALHSSEIKYKNLEMLSTVSVKEDNDNLDRDGLGTPPVSDIYTEVEVFEREGLLPMRDKEPVFDKEDSEGVVFKEMVATIAKCGEKVILIRLKPNPYGLKNYIDIHMYLDPERWQSMGMIEPIKDLQTAINDNVNAMFDEIWQNLMPPVIVNRYALWDWDTMQYAPQQRWLVGGDPNTAVKFKEASHVTRDAWQKNQMLDGELQLTSAITPSMQGVGKEKAATTNVMNAQMSAGRLDFIIKMIEQTGLIPSAQMDVIFAKKFAHPLTFQRILGKPFKYAEYEEIYNYIPAASSVKMEHQKQQETAEDIQLMGVLQNVQNPNTAKVLNILMANILRNRDMPKEAKLFDEDFYEPNSDAGNMQMMKKMLGNTPSNQNNVPMSGQEKGVRNLANE